MTTHLQLSLLLAAIFLANPTKAQSLICTENIAAGVSFNNGTKEWSATTKTASGKYVIRKSSNQLARLEIGELGSKAPVAFCEKDFEQDQLRCRGFYQEFFVNRAEMRFLRIYFAGYWNEGAIKKITPDHREGDDTPHVVIGKCTNI